MTENYCGLAGKNCHRGLNCGKNLPLYPGFCIHASGALANYATSRRLILSSITSPNQWQVVAHAEKTIGNRSQVAIANVRCGLLAPEKLKDKTLRTLRSF